MSIFRRYSYSSLMVAGILSAVQAQPGPKISTQTGQTEFFSKAAGPADDIYAIHENGAVTVNLETGAIDVTIDMRLFVLPKKLMTQHYNEKYMETGKFPFATFSGKLVRDRDIRVPGVHPVKATGDFTVHGVTRHRTFAGKIHTKGDTCTLTAEFGVQLADHAIPIPVLFFTKITEAVHVKARYVLQ